MPDLKLLRIEEGDSQKVFVDKINANFSNIITFGGGPYGKLGRRGPQGAQGQTGPAGSYGDAGKRGSIWTVGPTQPTSGTYYGAADGDFWMDVMNYNTVYQYNSGLWSLYGTNITSQDLFRVFGPLSTSAGVSNKSGYFFTSTNPSSYALVLHDSTFNAAGNSKYTFNPQYSKVVISTNASATYVNKKIMEFAKADYQDLPSVYSKTPKFYWATSGSDYGLKFDAFDGFSVETPGSNFNLTSYSSSVLFKTAGINMSLSSNQSGGSLVGSTISGDILFGFGGTASFSTTNLTYASNKFAVPIRGLFYYNPSIKSPRIPALWISTTATTSSNIRHRSDVPNDRNSFLFSVNDIKNTKVISNVSGNGDYYYNRRVDSIEAPQSVNNSLNPGTVNIYVGLVATAVTANWVPVIPSVAITSAVTNASVLNSGIDVVVDIATSTNAGICLWTPSSFTPATPPANNNGGWLSLLDSNECLIVRVRTSDPTQRFRFLGLSTGNQTSLPDGTIQSYDGNGQFVDISGDSSYGATQVEFTIMSIANSSSISTSRWFKVYYSAWGGNLGTKPGSTWKDTTKCGTLYTYNSTPF